MAGMFYSLEEAAAKLNMSAEEVHKLVEERKLREFRDGSHVLFKVSEVESLLADTGLVAAEAPAEKAPWEELPVEQAETEAPPEEAPQEELTFEPEAPAEAEPQGEPEAAAVEETAGAEPQAGLGDGAEQEELSLDDSLAMLSEPEQLDEGGPTGGEDLSVLPESEQEPAPAAGSKEDTEVSFSLDEQAGSSFGADVTGADTAVTREGMSVIDEGDSQFKIAEDTAAETKAVEEASSLEKIEEDVNLDTFGSGSGLLDLSLQADDTSLGGILDEIYTAPAEEGQGAAPEASAADISAAAEAMMTHEEPAAVAAAQALYVEAAPDASSNVFGGLLVLPLLVVIYTLVVAVAGQFGILSSLVPQGMMAFYGLGGVIVLALVIAGYGWSKGAPARPKQPKVKKEKPPKVKKEKKPKEEKVKKEKKK
jgi:excisionase family DNA binding protein